MWLRLSLALHIPIGELQRRVSSREFAEYLALWRLEPWGDARGDIAAAKIACTVANQHSKQRRPLRDFLPSWLRGGDRGRATSPEGMQAIADQFLAAYQGTRK